MEQRVFILSNTFPYGGEPFLNTELECLNDRSNVFCFPFFSSKSDKSASRVLQQNAHEFKNQITSWDRIHAGANSIKNLILKKELREAIRRNGKVRNIVKALKFAYISELRVFDAVRYIDSNFVDKSHMLFYAYWMYETAYAGARLKEEYPGSHFVTRCHGYDLYIERHANGYLPYRHFILESADVVYPISQQGKIYLGDLYDHVFDSKIHVARLGTRRLFDINRNESDPSLTTIVSCSNLIPLKRIHLIIEALRNTKMNIRWIHFGDGELRAELEKKASALPDNIHVDFKGFVQNKDIHEFYATHNITAFINVSETEGIPVSIMEAQSYGIPVIATDVGGTGEIVHDGVNGVILSKSFAPTDLLNAIDTVIKNYESYSNHALLTWQRMSDASVTTNEFYKELKALEE